MNGTLALVGSGEYLPAMEAVDRMLLSRLQGEPRVVCLPTAAGKEGPQSIGYWSRLGVKHFTRLGVRVEAVEVINRATAQDETFAARVRSANFVYLSGGKPDYLFRTLKATPVWSAIVGVLENGGVVAGCSAGAMIFGEHYPTLPTILPWQRAFNFLPGAIVMPHYDEIGESLGKFVRTLLPRGATLLGIEGYTALVSSASEFGVVGNGGVTVWDRKRKERFTERQAVRWR
jgi:cyanophycinase